MLTPTTRWTIAILGSLVLPFLAMWLYLFFLYPHHLGARGDYAALAVALLMGVGSICVSPLGAGAKWLIGFLYCIVMVPAQILFMLLFVCGAYQSCL